MAVMPDFVQHTMARASMVWVTSCTAAMMASGVVFPGYCRWDSMMEVIEVRHPRPRRRCDPWSAPLPPESCRWRTPPTASPHRCLRIWLSPRPTLRPCVGHGRICDHGFQHLGGHHHHRLARLARGAGDLLLQPWHASPASNSTPRSPRAHHQRVGQFEDFHAGLDRAPLGFLDLGQRHPRSPRHDLSSIRPRRPGR